MKLFSQSLELRAIRTIAVKNGLSDDYGTVSKLTTDSSSMLSSHVLAQIDESFFHFEPSKAAFKRVLKIAEKRSRILSYEDLIEDPALEEEYRDILKENKKARCKSRAEADDLIEQLDSYRKKRIIYEEAKTSIERLQESKCDVEDLLAYKAGMQSLARSRENLQDSILTVGKDANAKDLAARALSTESDVLLKTGFNEYDTKNGGLPSVGVFIMASTTSGGKSVTRMNLCKNIYELNQIDVLTVSLEMSDVKETRRLLSCLTGIDFWKFSKKALSKEEREQALNSFKDFHKFGKKNDCRYSIFCPTRGLRIEQLLMLVKAFKFRVIAIDYVSLLDGVDEKDQWKALSNVVRQCKIFSTENNCLIILLAQLDSEDDRIRYSKGMLEHADCAWVWNYSKPEQRELHTLPVQQKKARDQELFPFDLKEEFHIMRVSNPDSSAPEIKESSEKSSSKKKKSDSKREPNESKSNNEDGVKFDVS